MTSCQENVSPTIKELRWSEKVEVSAGETVEVSRHLKFGVSREMSEKVGMVIPSSARIEIVAAGVELPPIDVGPLTPTVLMRDDVTREFVVIAGTNNCRFWQRNDEPSPPYWAFRLHEAEWFRADLPPSAIGRPANLLFDIRPDDRDELDPAVVARRKSAQLSADGLSKSLRVVLANDPAKSNCGHAVGLEGELDFGHFRRL
jgi:hypothetical protein